jgi:hypothetical protein
VGCLAQQSHSVIPTKEDSLRKFLQGYLGEPRFKQEKNTRYFSAFVDLTGGARKDVIVYLTGDAWCGTGGCTMLVLLPSESSYQAIARVPAVWPPIRTLISKTNGWHDIGVWLQGGGIQPGYESELAFDGKSYSTNPSVPPAQPLQGKVVVRMTDVGIPLYP